MNDEIKEILDILKTAYDLYDIELTYKQVNVLYDYITNLQNENEHLSMELNTNMIERNNYLSRCERLLEKINFYKTTEWGLRSCAILDLFENILNGGDE